MAVLIEAISVVVRADTILKTYPGGWDRFQKDIPNQTFCTDGELIRVGFMSPDAVRRYVELLERKGLVYQTEEGCGDIAVIDQQHGFMVDCDWAEFGRLFIDPEHTRIVSACRLRGSLLEDISLPEGWEYEDSLSEQFYFVPTGIAERELEFIQQDGALYVYRHLPSGRIVYLGTPYGK